MEGRCVPIKLKIYNVGAAAGGDCFLIDNGINAVLIDSGFAYCAEQMTENIRARLGARPLDAVLLTHSHYDHASGSALCRELWRDAVIYAHPYAQKTFARPSALALMREMNENAAKLAGVTQWRDTTDLLHVDVTVEDGDTIEAGSLRFEVIGTPGHTRDSISFYCADAGLLVCAETLGAPADDNTVMPCYLVGYQMALDAIDRAAKYGTETLLTPHMGVMEGADAAERFFRLSKYWAEEGCRRVLEAYGNGASHAELTELWKNMFYVSDIGKSQPEKAFLLNAGITTKMLVRECLGEELSD